MKAVDYFREYGLVESKKHLEWMVRVEARRDIHGWFMDDLKRLIESHELVEKHGGLENAKDDEDVANDFGLGHKGLKQAIADVESCQ